jgi:YHS domain-containing protein
MRITALMLVTMILAALVIDLGFSALGLIPDVRPSADDVFGTIEVDYKLVLNVVATFVFVALIGLTVRRGATDPTCGMTVDKATALRLELDGRTHYFCSEHCRAAFAAKASGREQAHDGADAHDHDHAAQHGRV